MFDGVPADQFHQFLASSRTSLPIPLSFPLHHHHHHHVITASAPAPAPSITPTPTFLGCFDPYPSAQTLDLPPPHHHHHHHHHHQHQSGLHHQSPITPPTITITTTNNSNSKIHDDDKEEEENGGMLSRNLEIEREGSISGAPITNDPTWSSDEVLTLLRIRSSMETWYPESPWEHVSRKLAELGYHRSADKCKEKFEEESRHFNNMNYTKNYRFFTDLDELYHDENTQVSTEKNQDLGKEKDKQEEDKKMDPSLQEEDTEDIAVGNPSDQENAEMVKEPVKNRKRKRKYKFEMFKNFCEAVVKKIFEQQEELHNKLIEDMVKRDEESIAREEAWRCQEIDRINKEIELRAQEQATACGRQVKIVELLKKFTPAGSHEDLNLIRRIEDLLKVTNSSSSVTSSTENLTPISLNGQSKLDVVTSSSKIIPHQNPTLLLSKNNPSLPTSSSETTPSPHNHCSTAQATSSPLAIAFQNPNNNSNKVHDNPLVSSPSSAQKSSQQMISAPNERGELTAGKRWPRDEVQALINLKCSLSNNSTDDNKTEGAKGPLWERISQGMQELGYRRSAKRCKEKWENINKYFRKTKDNKKNRSLDSRTCPYFHQLSTLYSQGTLVAPSDAPENRQNSPENP